MSVPRFLSAGLLAGLALTGCATPPATDYTQLDIDCQILDASQKIQAAQVDLFQAGAISKATVKQPAPIADDQYRVTLSWQGDALQLLDKLAHDRGLVFSFMGVRMPLPVNVDVENMPFDAVLQLVRTQIAYRADVTQYPDKLTLQFNRPQS